LCNIQHYFIKYWKLKLYLVCDIPPPAQDYATTIPPNISGQFLAGDSIQYSCNGNLVPDDAATNTCSEGGANLAAWSFASIADLPVCSKYIMQSKKRSLKNLVTFKLKFILMENSSNNFS